MISFESICKETKEKLGRQLREDEIAFLKWMVHQYREEIGEEQKVECKHRILHTFQS